MSDFYVDDLNNVMTNFEFVVFLLCTHVSPSNLTHTLNAKDLTNDVVPADEMFLDVYTFENVLSNMN